MFIFGKSPRFLRSIKCRFLVYVSSIWVCNLSLKTNKSRFYSFLMGIQRNVRKWLLKRQNLSLNTKHSLQTYKNHHENFIFNEIVQLQITNASCYWFNRCTLYWENIYVQKQKAISICCVFKPVWNSAHFLGIIIFNEINTANDMHGMSYNSINCKVFRRWIASAARWIS